MAKIYYANSIMKVVCMYECCVMDVFFCPECGMLHMVEQDST